MKRTMMILFSALVIFMAGCTDIVIVQPSVPAADAWKYDCSLPVPILLGGEARTKVINNPADMDGLTFHIFAMDKDSTAVSLMLDDEKTVYDGASGTFMFDGEEGEPELKYYPSDSRRNYSFYSFHHVDDEGCSVIADSTRILVDMPVADTSDILWGKAEASGADGFNARYVRNNPDERPAFSFEHPAARLSFSASLADEDVMTKVYVERLIFNDIPTRAVLCVADCAEENSQEGMFCGTSVEDDVPFKSGVPIHSAEHVFIFGHDVYICPQEKIDCVLTVDGEEYPLTLDPSALNPVLSGFEAGKYYRFNFVIGENGVSVGVSKAIRLKDDVHEEQIP